MRVLKAVVLCIVMATVVFGAIEGVAPQVAVAGGPPVDCLRAWASHGTDLMSMIKCTWELAMRAWWGEDTWWGDHGGL